MRTVISMATTDQYNYRETDQALTTSYITFYFKTPVRAIQISNYGTGGSIKNPKTTGSNIVVNTFDNEGTDNFRIPPGKAKRISGMLFTGIKLKRDAATSINFEIDSIRG